MVDLPLALGQADIEQFAGDCAAARKSLEDARAGSHYNQTSVAKLNRKVATASRIDFLARCSTSRAWPHWELACIEHSAETFTLEIRASTG